MHLLEEYRIATLTFLLPRHDGQPLPRLSLVQPRSQLIRNWRNIMWQIQAVFIAYIEIRPPLS